MTDINKKLSFLGAELVSEILDVSTIKEIPKGTEILKEEQYINVISPGNGQFWHIGNEYNIEWQSNITGNVRIYLLLEDIYHEEDDVSRFNLYDSGNRKTPLNFSNGLTQEDVVDKVIR